MYDTSGCLEQMNNVEELLPDIMQKNEGSSGFGVGEC